MALVIDEGGCSQWACVRLLLSISYFMGDKEFRFAIDPALNHCPSIIIDPALK